MPRKQPTCTARSMHDAQRPPGAPSFSVTTISTQGKLFQKQEDETGTSRHTTAPRPCSCELSREIMRGREGGDVTRDGEDGSATTRCNQAPVGPLLFSSTMPFLRVSDRPVPTLRFPAPNKRGMPLRFSRVPYPRLSTRETGGRKWKAGVHFGNGTRVSYQKSRIEC